MWRTKNSRNGVPGIHAAAQQAASIFVTEIPSGYRDWTLIPSPMKRATFTVLLPFCECSQPIIAANSEAKRCASPGHRADK